MSNLSDIKDVMMHLQLSKICLLWSTTTKQIFGTAELYLCLPFDARQVAVCTHGNEMCAGIINLLSAC